MRTSARLPSEDVAITSLWSVLLRSWLRALVVAGLTGAIAFTAMALAPPRYVATSEIGLPEARSEEATTAVVEALRSRALLSKLAADLDLVRNPEFNSALSPRDFAGWLQRITFASRPRPGETVEKRIIDAVDRSLTVTPLEKGAAIAVSMSARTPEIAARAADQLVELYLASASAAPAVPNAEAAEMTREIARLSQEVATAEAEMTRLAGPSSGMAQQQRRSDLADALAQAERERADAESRALAVRTLLNKGNVEAIAELQTSPTLHQLIAERVRVEVQKTGAERTLPAGHQRILDLQTRLSELRWQMFREATAISSGLDAEVRAAASREAEARTRLASAKSSGDAPADADGEAARRRADLEQQIAVKRSTIAELEARRTAVSVTTGSREKAAGSERRSTAQTIAVPLFPYKGQLALLAAVSVLMIGFVFIILRTLLGGDRRAASDNGFADMVATARDRADVRFDSQSPAERGTGDVRSAQATMEHPLPEAAENTNEKIADLSGHKIAAVPAEPGQFVILSATADAARHIAGRAMGRRGYRTLLVADGIDGAGEARDLIAALAIPGRRCVLVDWSRNGKGIAAALGAAQQPGINDLLTGRANFDDVIARLPGSDAHFVAAGTALPDPARPLDADWTNLVLDALDEAYDHILVVADLDEARVLFEAIEGRFDAGIVMSDRKSQGSTINAGPGVFLGFEVTEIYIVQMSLAQGRAATRRLKRGRRQAVA